MAEKICVGELINGRYEILKSIGQGGMAEVYKARCHLLNRLVAIKFLKEEFLEDREFVERFDTEAKSAAGMAHTNIVSVYDVGEAKGRKYIVMEYVEGITLKEYIKTHGKLTWREATSVAGQICSALSCAHMAGIIHRDIKPHNIVLTKSGVAKVTDFGIARAVTQSTRIKADKSILGSAHYFSPEQGFGSNVDRRTDIYSLGIVMYEMLTGKVPFDNENPISLALMHLNSPFPDIKAHTEDVPEDLIKVVLTAVEKEPDKRYSSADKMLYDLKNVIKGNELVYAGKVTPPPVIKEEQEDETDEKLEKQTKIITLVAAGAICLVVGIVIVLGLIFVSSMGSGGGEDKPLPVVTLAPTPDKPDEENEDNEIPNVINYKKDAAEDEMKDAGYKVKFEEKETDKKEEDGKVIMTSPSAGTVYPKGSVVTLYVGKKVSGDELSVVDVMGKSEEDAKKLLGEDFKVSVVYRDTDDKDDVGKVVKQSPISGEKLTKGSAVEITVGRAKKMLVPNVVGKTEEDAKKLLDDFKIIIKEKEVEPDKAGKVLEQSPVGGEEIKSGGEVIITIGKSDKVEKKISFKVPAPGGWVKVVVSGETVLYKTYNEGDEASVKIYLKEGESKEVQIYLDDKLIDTKSVSA